MSWVDCIVCRTAIDDATAVLTPDGPICDRCVLRRQVTEHAGWTRRPTALDRDTVMREARRRIAAGVAIVLFGLYLTSLHRYGQLVVLAGILIGAWGWRDARASELVP